MTDTAAPKFRYIGTTDECVVCQRCGKPDLKHTVVLAMLDEAGEDDGIVYYGSTCAARALSIWGGGSEVRDRAKRATRQTVAAAREARRMLGVCRVTDAGEFISPNGIRLSAGLYRKYNTHLVPGIMETPPEELRAEVQNLITQWVKAIADAKLIGVRV